MHVKLISISQPVDDVTPDTATLLAYQARVSSTGNQNNHETGTKLLKSLIKRKEWSPFEMIHLGIEIHTTRDIARQILRHRSFSFQEFSQRYAKVEKELIPREVRLQDLVDRQNSIENTDTDLEKWWNDRQYELGFRIHDLYDLALEQGIAKEVARAILPEGMTPSALYMAGTLRSWIHYVQLRADRKTQKEHRMIAERCKEILIERFPDLKEVFE